MHLTESGDFPNVEEPLPASFEETGEKPKLTEEAVCEKASLWICPFKTIAEKE